jgi:hypothetical protein
MPPDPRQAMIDRILGAIPGAQQITSAIGEAAPPGFGGFIEPGLQQAIEFNLREGGMPQQEYDLARGRLGSGLNQALSRSNVASARRGSFNPQSAAAASRPAFANFGNQLAQLEGQRANLRQRAVTQAGQQLTSLAPIAAAQSQAAQTGFGDFLRQLAAGPRQSVTSSRRGRGGFLGF